MSVVVRESHRRRPGRWPLDRPHDSVRVEGSARGSRVFCLMRLDFWVLKKQIKEA